MKSKVKKAIGGLLAIFASGAVGGLTVYLWPMFTMWFIRTDLLWPLSIGTFVVIMLLSALIPSIPEAITDHFKMRKSNVLAVVCALFMGLPVTIRQIMNWSVYTQPTTQNGWRVEGGSGWIAFLFTVIPGIMFIVATFLQMAGTGDKAASHTKAPSGKKAPSLDIENTIPLSRRSRKLALFLAVFPLTGFLGIDRYYLGYIGTGIFKFLTAGGLVVLYVADIIKIAKGTMRDKGGDRLREGTDDQTASQRVQKMLFGKKAPNPDMENTIPLSRRSRKLALFLAIFPWTGFLGIDRFYLGYVGIGILKFLTAGGFVVLYTVDIILIAKGTMRDKDGNILR